MKSVLFYHIAEQRLVIETPDGEQTERLLPSFADFLSKEKSEKDDDLFRFSGHHFCSLPDAPLVEEFTRNPFHYAVYETGSGKLIRMSRGEEHHHLLVPPDLLHFRCDLTLTDMREAPFLNSFLMIAYTLAAAPLKTVKLHASVIEREGKAILFLGNSGTGKSTHTRLWQEHIPGSRLLNDDEPVVRIMEDESVRVFGSPWSGSTPCYRNISAEVVAFVRLYQHPENKLTPIKGIAAFTALFQSAAILRSDEQHHERLFGNVTEIIERVPFYRLDCRPDREAVMLSATLMR
ncbi:MAG: hypothetical protein JG761_1297 [Proteiniphilum sp.]|jgi:hypothetical protein|nr:hypothetical protein [Proteiniphilum sp.]